MLMLNTAKCTAGQANQNQSLLLISSAVTVPSFGFLKGTVEDFCVLHNIWVKTIFGFELRFIGKVCLVSVYKSANCVGFQYEKVSGVCVRLFLLGFSCHCC